VLTFDISRGGHYVETRRQVIRIEGMRWKSRNVKRGLLLSYISFQSAEYREQKTNV
jgi:hypothetical protein